MLWLVCLCGVCLYEILMLAELDLTDRLAGWLAGPAHFKINSKLNFFLIFVIVHL
jgi:hypothetical protein